MKRVFLSIILTAFCLCINAQYNCVVKESDRESVTFRVVGYGSNTKKTTVDAELSAIKNICFYGAEGTIYSTPLVPTGEDKAIKDNPDFFSNLFSTQYRNFIESSIAISNLGKDASKRKCQTFDVKVSVVKLRKYFEQNGIIRKFGL